MWKEVCFFCLSLEPDREGFDSDDATETRATERVAARVALQPN